MNSGPFSERQDPRVDHHGDGHLPGGNDHEPGHRAFRHAAVIGIGERKVAPPEPVGKTPVEGVSLLVHRTVGKPLRCPEFLPRRRGDEIVIEPGDPQPGEVIGSGHEAAAGELVAEIDRPPGLHLVPVQQIESGARRMRPIGNRRCDPQRFGDPLLHQELKPIAARRLEHRRFEDDVEGGIFEVGAGGEDQWRIVEIGETFRHILMMRAKCQRTIDTHPVPVLFVARDAGRMRGELSEGERPPGGVGQRAHIGGNGRVDVDRPGIHETREKRAGNRLRRRADAIERRRGRPMRERPVRSPVE